MINKVTLLKFSILFLLLCPFVTQALLVVLKGASITPFIIRVGGFSEIIPFVFVLICGIFFNDLGVKKHFAFLYYLSFLTIIYALITVFLGLFSSYLFKYVFGDAFRYLLPYFGIISYVFFLKKDSEILQFFSILLKCLLFILFLKILAKLMLLVSGTFYGGGLNQFYIEPFLLTILLYGTLHNGLSTNSFHISRKLCMFLLLISVFLVVLSFKRSYWILLFFVFVINSFYFNFKFKFFALVFTSFAFLFYFFSDSYFVGLLIDRVMYTFNNSSSIGIDKSSFERLAEVKGVLFHISDNGYFLNYIFGMGSGAEFVQHPDYSLAKQSTGSKYGYFHHIHSMYFIILFRHGLIGLLPLVFVFVFCILKFLPFRKLKCLETAVMFAVIVQLLSMFISGISSNSAYGYGALSVFVIVFFCASYILKKKLKTYEDISVC